MLSSPVINIITINYETAYNSKAIVILTKTTNAPFNNSQLHLHAKKFQLLIILAQQQETVSGSGISRAICKSAS